MNEVEVFDLLERIERAYPNRSFRLDEEVVGEWHRYFQNQEYSKIQKNFDSHVQNSPHPPTIADLLGNTETTEDEYPPGFRLGPNEHAPLIDPREFDNDPRWN